jgi:hypothetical protein
MFASVFRRMDRVGGFGQYAVGRQRFGSAYAGAPQSLIDGIFGFVPVERKAF